MYAGGWKPLLLAASVASARQQHPVLIAAAESIPHHLLLPECSAVVHHGGAGTSAATLLAGLPHIICPFHFDQFNWVSQLHSQPQSTQEICQCHCNIMIRTFMGRQRHDPLMLLLGA